MTKTNIETFNLKKKLPLGGIIGKDNRNLSTVNMIVLA